MANEIRTQQTSLSGAALYATLDRGGQRFNGTAFVAVSAAAWPTFAVPMTEATGTGYFAANMPAAVNTPGVVQVTVYKRVGSSPAVTDPVVAAGTVDWTGTAETSVSALPTLSQIDTQLSGAHGAGAWGGGSGGGSSYTPAQIAAAVWTDTSDLGTPGTPGFLLAQNLDTKVSTRSTFAGGPVASVTAPVTVGTNNDKAGYALAASGLDTITVEVGVNARQALSPILAASAGVLLGAGTGSVVIKGGNVGVTRITAATDNAGNRTSVNLSLPA